MYRAREANSTIKIPFGIDRYFCLSRDPAESRLARYVLAFHEEEKGKLRKELADAEAELLALSASAARRKTLENRREKIRSRLSRELDRPDPLDDRIFPYYFAPAIVTNKGERVLRAMRYRIRNKDGSEIPDKYNVFNARKDSLLSARTWRPHFGKSHALFPFSRFYEWVERDGRKQEIYFSPGDRGVMWAPALYSAPASAALPSFALVTDEPPPEVAAAGHDRCPVFLSESEIEGWLNPQKRTRSALLAMLEKKENVRYLHDLAA
jgi:putative SOS response-associated peptidase YedK